MSSWSTLPGVTITRRPNGRTAILPEDVYTLNDDPTEAGETGPEWPAESRAQIDEADDFIDDGSVMGRAA